MTEALPLFSNPQSLLQSLVQDAQLLDGTLAAKGDDQRTLSLRVRLMGLRARLTFLVMDLAGLRPASRSSGRSTTEKAMKVQADLQRLKASITPKPNELPAAPKSSAPPAAPTPARNAPCPCGSKKKYKQCCEKAGARMAAAPPMTV